METNKIPVSTTFNNVYKWHRLMIAITMITSITINTEAISLKEKICNFLLLPIASPVSSDATISKAEALSKALNPKATVTVKNLNALGRLLVGYKNTISIPFVNYVLVNEKWLETLSPKAEEFILARSMMYLFSYPYEYSAYKYIFPLLLYNFCKLLNEYIDDYHIPQITGSKKQLIYYTTEVISCLLSPYYLRKIEYKIDASAATNFNCFDGAISAITDSSKFSHNGSILDTLNSTISGIEIADLIANLGTPFAKHNTHRFGPAAKIIKTLLTPTPAGELALPLNLLLSPKFLVPGRFTDRQSMLGNFIKNLPLINLAFDYPKPYKRIRELTTLRNQILKNKINEQKTKKG